MCGYRKRIYAHVTWPVSALEITYWPFLTRPHFLPVIILTLLKVPNYDILIEFRWELSPYLFPNQHKCQNISCFNIHIDLGFFGHELMTLLDISIALKLRRMSIIESESMAFRQLIQQFVQASKLNHISLCKGNHRLPVASHLPTPDTHNGK